MRDFAHSRSRISEGAEEVRVVNACNDLITFLNKHKGKEAWLPMLLWSNVFRIIQRRPKQLRQYIDTLTPLLQRQLNEVHAANKKERAEEFLIERLHYKALTPMQAFGYVPKETVSMIVDARCAGSSVPAADITAAHMLLQQMLQQPSQYAVAADAFTPLLRESGECLEIDHAMQLFNSLEHRDVRVYTALLRTLLLHERYDEMPTWLQRMQAAGVKPDAVTHAILFKAIMRQLAHIRHMNTVHKVITRNSPLASAVAPLLHQAEKPWWDAIDTESESHTHFACAPLLSTTVSAQMIDIISFTRQSHVITRLHALIEQLSTLECRHAPIDCQRTPSYSYFNRGALILLLREYIFAPTPFLHTCDAYLFQQLYDSRCRSPNSRCIRC